YCSAHPRSLQSLPTRRSSDLYDHAFNDKVRNGPGLEGNGSYDGNRFSSTTRRYHRGVSGELLDAYVYSNFHFGNTAGDIKIGRQDRKSTRLNSSHVQISYAVF